MDTFGLEALIPFAVIIGLALLVIYVVHVVNGYTTPTSFSHSVRRTAAGVGSAGGGWIVSKLVLGRTGSLGGWEFLIALCGVGAALLIVDLVVLTRNGRRSPE